MTVILRNCVLIASGANARGVAADGVNISLYGTEINATTPIDVAAGTTVQVSGCTFDPNAVIVAGTLLAYLYGDRGAWDVANYSERHASDISGSTWVYHRNPMLAGSYTVTHPSVRRILDVTSVSLNEMAALLGTILDDLGWA